MKFGIVGTNFISDMFMNAVLQMEDVSVVAVCSRKKENAEKFADKYKIPFVFDDYIQMIESKEIDAIYLAVPNSMHYPMTMECLKRKMPTFTEKPFASNAKEAKEMIDYAKKQETYLHDGFVPAYTKNIQKIKEELKVIGPIRRAIFSFGKYSSRYDSFLQNENPTTFRRELSNGSAMDIGVYPLGVAILLFGKPKKIFASAILLETKVDGLGTCILQYENFEVVVLHSKITDTKVISEIQGEKGIIQIDTISQMKGLTVLCRNQEEKTIQDDTEKFIYQIQDFMENIKLGRLESKIFPHQKTIDILEALDECRKQMGVIYPADK